MPGLQQQRYNALRVLAVVAGATGLLSSLGMAACQAPDANGTPIAGIYTPPSGDVDETNVELASCSERPKGPRPDPASLPTCCSGTGRCLESKWLMPREKAQLGKQSCEDNSVCVPTKVYLAATGGEKPKTCKSVGETEGRCMSVCLPEVASNLEALPDDVCEAGTEKCSPCVNPLTNKRTGACELGNDVIDPNAMPASCGAASAGGTPGGENAVDETSPGLPCPYTGPDILNPDAFASCGEKAHCLVEALVTNKAQAAELGSCKTKDGSNGLCVPDIGIRTGGNFIAKTCVSVGGVEGRCLNKILPKIAAQVAKLPKDTCDASEACAPCYNPEDGLDTGACTQTCDPGPKETAPGPIMCPYRGKPLMDPNYFAACGGAGSGAHCLPANMISTPDLAKQLNNCRTKEGRSNGKCVPDTFITTAGKYVPPTCKSIKNAEGRCLNTVLKQVAERGDTLPRATCAANERCSPCYDPIDGSSTSACSQGCDAPTRPPVVFNYCCGGRARCVPSSIVPSSKRDKLSSCGGGELCAPNETLSTGYQPVACEGWALLLGGSYSGACVSDCVPVSGLQNIVLKQGTCRGGDRCVPCYAQGSSTGACDRY